MTCTLKVHPGYWLASPGCWTLSLGAIAPPEVPLLIRQVLSVQVIS